MTVSEITPIQIDDKDFLVASTIDRCPKVMMIRELMMNALEAASLALEGKRRVELSTRDFDGTSKLVIWNTGPGMDAQELYTMCDLAASIGKQKSLDGNFGMGAKVASLPSNRLGIRYRSCKSGKVSEVILCERQGVYGRLRRYDEDGTYEEVIDVTEMVQVDGLDVSADWTEVMMLGNDLRQDTARDPYNGDPKVDSQWLATYLYHRFYRVPKGVRVVLHSGTHKLGDGTRNFDTIPGRAAAGAFDRAEMVDLGQIKVHYLYDGPYERSPSYNRSISGAIQSDVSTCAVVYKNEMYDLHKGRGWTMDAPKFGIPFGARHISVHIELADDAAVRAEGYRQFLRYNGGEQDPVEATDFAELVAHNRPTWLIELIKSYAPEGRSSDEVRNELQQLLDELRVQRISPRVVVDGASILDKGPRPAAEGTRGSGGGNGGGGGGGTARPRPTDLSVLPTGAKRADLWKNRERAPEIIELRSDEEIEDKQLKARAARYYDHGQLFVNMNYPSIALMREDLETRCAGAPDLEAMRLMAVQLAERTMIVRVGRAVVFALAKQLNKEWDIEAVKQALMPESLSLAADDFLDALQSARRKMSKTFRPSQQSVDAELEEDLVETVGA